MIVLSIVARGLNKRNNLLTKECFMKVLKTGESRIGVNKGFIRRDNQTFTYDQIKTGLSYFYAKRRVCSDGVTTLPIKA